MKFIDDFRNAALAGAILTKLHETVKDPLTVMEVCGTHTMTVFRYGLRGLLPDGFRLVAGPGCPICVTPKSYVDEALKLSQRHDVIITTFGDLLRVPGTRSSLLQEKNRGRDIRVVYGPLDALEVAASNPSRQIIFLGVGFETTAPIVALAVLEAERRKLKNFRVFSAHKTMPPAMAALAAEPELEIEGFLCPGHVSMVIGLEPYRFLTGRYGIPAVIAGFEPLDILQGLLILTELIQKEEAQVINAYTRVVTELGNPTALQRMYQVFMPENSIWRGMGGISGSGLRIRPEYADFDAREMFEIDAIDAEESGDCSCGEIIIGKKIPPDCKLYKTICTPDHPVGACMVSSEGACAAYYKYGG